MSVRELLGDCRIFLASPPSWARRSASAKAASGVLRRRVGRGQLGEMVQLRAAALPQGRDQQPKFSVGAPEQEQQQQQEEIERLQWWMAKLRRTVALLLSPALPAPCCPSPSRPSHLSPAQLLPELLAAVGELSPSYTSSTLTRRPVSSRPSDLLFWCAGVAMGVGAEGAAESGRSSGEASLMTGLRRAGGGGVWHMWACAGRVNTWCGGEVGWPTLKHAPQALQLAPPCLKPPNQQQLTWWRRA